MTQGSLNTLFFVFVTTAMTMLFEYIIQVYYIILTFFFPSYKTMTKISVFYAICCIRI